MKYTFLGSLIPHVFLLSHSLKTLNFYYVFYFSVYVIHLTGRPFYFDVQTWFQIQRATELGLFLPYKMLFIALLPLKASIHKTSLYALCVFMSNQFMLSCALVAIVCLHEIPIGEKNVNEYFQVRMLRNFVLFLILFNETKLLWSAFAIILFFTIVWFLCVSDKSVETEYFLNGIPSTYPVPLDIKDAIKHCKTAKILFKKNAV